VTRDQFVDLAEKMDEARYRAQAATLVKMAMDSAMRDADVPEGVQGVVNAWVTETANTYATLATEFNNFQTEHLFGERP
jgi:hypothetical protein